MTEAPATQKVTPEQLPRSLRSLLASTEVDTRLLGMVAALAIIWIGFNLMSGGLFLTPRNLWNLSVQSSSIAIMATGMVLIIVSRNIDLSVGSLLGLPRLHDGHGPGDLAPDDPLASGSIALVAGRPRRRHRARR